MRLGTLKITDLGLANYFKAGCLDTKAVAEMQHVCPEHIEDYDNGFVTSDSIASKPSKKPRPSQASKKSG